MPPDAKGDEVNEATEGDRGLDDLQTSALPQDDRRTEWEKGVERRFRLGDSQFGRIRGDIKAMRTELKANSDITGEIRDVVMAFAAFSRFCKRVGRVIAWGGRKLAWTGRFAFRVLKVGGAIAASVGTIWAVIWAATHGLAPPGELHDAVPTREQPPGGRSIERPSTSTRK